MTDQPLLGKRVLVTRPLRPADPLVRGLERLGATTVQMPVVAVDEPDDWDPVDRALAELDRYQWLVFTSVNGVQALLDRARHTGRDLLGLPHLRLAAIGPETASALRARKLAPEVVPHEFSSEGLVAALRDKVRGQRVLLARADRGRDLLREELAKVAAVEQVAVYSQRDVVGVDEQALAQLRGGRIDYITLTSSSIARALARLLDDGCRERIAAGRLRLISISPVTTAALWEEGLKVAAEARVYTMDGIIEALLELAARERQID